MNEGLPTNLKFSKNIDSAIGNISFGRFLFLIAAFHLIACSDRKGLVDQKLYEGPTSSLDSVKTLLSDSANVVLRLTAPKQLNYENGDQEWPEGFLLESNTDDGEAESSFVANYVFYDKNEDLYHATGNVIVKNYENGDELNTEELYWDPVDEEFFTEKFVTIKSEGEVHTGEGLKATQDFSEYTILNPSGTFTVEESN